ncbi:hypothetical protein K2173_024518 [Erythroxylum novogranatense]|uniref:Sulfotransferase n=1 Tax=Erythroxylum novogranatense TaxID=1862640 RepID=A0AAV8SVL7_9ROSI|nr:hypothetical protein K2173_024518 [Erythroxylum novogranatense]
MSMPYSSSSGLCPVDKNKRLAKDTDVVLATVPKSGTTWLKDLAFAILNHDRFADKNRHPLLSSNPHDLVPFFEYKVYANNHVPDLTGLSDPRIFATHVRYGSLQESIKKSNCRIVCICRNPFDNFMSLWFFINNVSSRSLPPLSMEEMFKMYCKGVVGYGPFWDHMLGYWKESMDRPDKVLFLKYEDMKEDVTFYIKKLAKFLGCPFSVQEEIDGVVEDIARKVNTCYSYK